MKIAFVFTPAWTPHSDGALQIWNKEVTTRLSKCCEVLVYSGLFTFQRHEYVDGISYRRFSTRLDVWLRNRFDSIRRRLGFKGPVVCSDLWYLGFAFKVALDLRKQRCDVVHVHYHPQIANLIKRFNPKLRVILHMHGEWLTQIKFTNLAARLQRFDLVISCSDFITRTTRANFPQIASRCKTVPMGLSPEAFSHAYQNPDPDNSSGRRLLCVSRISPEKGIHVLLDAFELIVRQYPDATLTIVGPEGVGSREETIDLWQDREAAASIAPFYEGDYMSQLKERVSPEAAKQITFIGNVAHSEVPAYCGAADIYVSPSLYESFGMSVIEAMAAGLPVVAARVKSFEDLISNEHTGLLVETSNPSAIAEGVIKLSENDSLRKSISRAAHEMISKQYSWDTICSTLMQIYGVALGIGATSSEHAEMLRK